MAEYASPKNDTPVFNPIEFLTLETQSAVSTDVDGLQEEIDALDAQIVVQETALSTIGLPNITLALQTTFTTTSNGGQWTAYTASLSAGVYLVKFFCICDLRNWKRRRNKTNTIVLYNRNK